MVRTGKQYLKAISNDRNIYLNGEKITDVTTHPAFKGITKTFARMYDIAADESSGMTYETEDGTIANKGFMIPKSREDLTSRRKSVTKWAEATAGFVGRTPDNVATLLAAFAAQPELFSEGGEQYKDNVLNFYKYARDNDLFVTYAIIPPQFDRSKAASDLEERYLQAGVFKELEDGIVVRGSMMLGTSSAVADYIFISCLPPLQKGDDNYAISFVVPVNAPGLKLYSRPAFALNKPSVFDYPLSTRFDESDSMVYLDDVYIPWEHVFVYKNIELTNAQFHEAPAHLYTNNFAQIRFVTKLKFLLGVAKKITEMNGTERFPQVREKIADIAGIAATVESGVLSSEYACTFDENGNALPNRRFVYGVIGMQDRLYPEVISIIRELSGGGVLQLPSSYLELTNDDTKDDIRRLVRSSTGETYEKTKLFKLAWDIVGSEFGGRHQQYEMFYNGAPYVTKGYCYRNYNFEEPIQLVDSFFKEYDIPNR